MVELADEPKKERPQNKNLKIFKPGDITPEVARERGRIGGIKSGIAKREKKRISQVYADFLMREHDIIGKDGLKRSISGEQLLQSVMSKVLARGDASSVSMMKEIREGTEGQHVTLTGDSDNPVAINILGVVAKDKNDG